MGEYTHFVSLPLAIHEDLKEKLKNFQERILALVSMSKELQGQFEKSIFINPKTFHLTVLMLQLNDEEQVKAAAEVLQRASPLVYSALEGYPVAVNIKGLECFGNNPAKAHVVYACVEDTGHRLLRACEVIINAFKESGLVQEKDRHHNLKLHATVINTRHREMADVPKLQGRNSNMIIRIPVDARRILHEYGSHVWGQYLITEAHLSERGKYDNNGYYHCCSSIQFPLIK